MPTSTTCSLFVIAAALGLLGKVGCVTVKINSDTQSFGSVVKGFQYKNVSIETTLFEKNFSSSGYVTEQWYTGTNSNQEFNQNTRIRIYIDGKEEPSIDYMVLMAHAVLPGATNNKPRSNRFFGKLASGGGYFNTFRIPFNSNIKITMTNDHSTGTVW